MNGRLIFAAGLLVGSTTGAVLTAAGLRHDTPAPALAPAQQVERLTEIECAPTTKEPATPMTAAPPVPYQEETP